MKQIPIGIVDFKKMIKENYYFVDKTKFIEEVILNAEVKLFTRPRRFGKTLNLSMIKYFFDIENTEENKKLFSGLYIEKSSAFSEQGKYPVISISMKDFKSPNFDRCINTVKILLSKLYINVLNKITISNENYNKICTKYINKDVDIDEIEDGLFFLSEILHNYYNQKVIVLIDEYDSPLINAYTEGYYDEAVNFFKTFYGKVLKDNIYLKKGIMTGIIRVASAGIFSDLNNLDIYTILNTRYDEYFGLTEPEVIKALNDFKLEYKIDEVKSWYDGYKFGNKEIYNPWSILKFIETENLENYWIGTSGNDLIKETLYNTDSTNFDSIKTLIDGKSIIVPIDKNVSLGSNITKNNIWELLLFSGYITIKQQIDNEKYEVKLPNQEVESLFKQLFSDFIFKNTGYSHLLVNALKEKKLEKVVEILKNLVLNTVSYYDTTKKYENSYHMLLLGFMYNLSEYKVVSNEETGYGRADITLKPINKSYPGYILELKIADKSEDLKKVAKKALKQINEKEYDSKLKIEEVSEIIKIGLAFKGKEVEAIY